MELNQEIAVTEKQISDMRSKLTQTNEDIDDTNQLIAKIELLESDIAEINVLIRSFSERHNLETIKAVSTKTPKDALDEYQKKLTKEKMEMQVLLNGSSGETDKDSDHEGLIARLEDINKRKLVLVSTADGEEKVYQKYLSDYKEWEDEKKKIEGDATTENTIAYFEAEQLYINEQLEPAYIELRKKREDKITELFNIKQNLAAIYKNIYRPIEAEIGKLLGDLEENISFEAEIQLLNSNLADALLDHINKNYVGIFKGKTESQNKMNQLIRQTEFGKIDSILEFVNNVMCVVDEDIDISSKKIADKKVFYDQLCALEYIGVAFKLKVGERDLEELSPGERGIVLLIFYLALNKNSTPIIIDQPEDNLDNQSVYSKLVPCICEAKKKRQVVIVTHNPNIAIACDAEQIVFCNIDKASNSIRYEAGAIEDPCMKKHVIDVLEGTMPAFDLRKRKYFKHE